MPQNPSSSIPLSSTLRRPLPEHWVGEIFRRLQGLYGSLWVSRWRSDTVDHSGMDTGVANAMRVWGEELGGFAEQPERIKAALQACRSQALPPTLPEFIAFCLAAPAAAPAPLPAPRLTPEQMAGNIERAHALVAALAQRPQPGIQWAHRLRQRYLAGDALPEISIRYGAEVLGEVWRDRRCEAKARPPCEADDAAMPP